MIELRNVKKSFGDRVLYENLNLTITDGEFAVLIGASGCGKTTLLDIIAGIEPIDSGEVIVDGLNIQKRRDRLAYYRSPVLHLFCRKFKFRQFPLDKSKML